MRCHYVLSPASEGVDAKYCGKKTGYRMVDGKRMYHPLCDEHLKVQHFRYGRHDATHFRWWKDGDPGDYFDVIDQAELDHRTKTLRQVGHIVTDDLFSWEDDL